MALINNPPASNGNATFSLLNFANDASSSIQEAFSKPVKKRKVNIRKYIQKRVKRLNSSSASNKGVVRSANDQQTKSKSALNKTTTSRRRSPTVQLTTHSQSLPVLNRPTVSSSISAHSLQFSYSDSNLYHQLPQLPVENPDSALDDILTVLGLENSPAMSRCSSDSMVDITTYIPPQSILESQLPLAEHPLIDRPYSPYSDCSDELFEDSAYSSPSSGSYNCSPVPPQAVTTTGCDWTPANSPPMSSMQYPITSSCNWMPSCVPAVSAVAGCDYLPYHQSPPCDQVLLSPTIWECINYPENF